ncbi:hypothetical protein EI982_01555 [Haloplanus rallus]|uniref:Uncharacterized protein n=1 Tax=Haloplanus rallus TaxID=1816183 RepID=A0A6B9F5C2_9EURY|nr:SipW-dependent-type signal peptide-containing protein [Haloplanus rallus]QGX93571.1 hypothetical protein EI982_01555 [Haloplanus rallus]
MSDQRFDLSRRKALAALGTIGVASAGAGLGTSAYFSDQETFENNQLTAGTLDLGVGYSTHYSDWSDGEGDGVSVRMYDGAAGETGSVDDLQSGETGLPTNDAWLIAVDDPDQFLDNTQQNEVPNDGCGEVGALTQADGESAIIDIGDVKPGDFGEVTFDLELCTNPGYVWINNPGGYTADENGTTEPERDDPDEADGEGEDYDDVVELLDVVQAAVWLDDGDNYQDGGESPLLVDSLRNVLDALNSGNGVRIDGQNVEAADASPDDFTSVGVNRFDFDGGGSDIDFELVDDPAGTGNKVAHATSGGVQTNDYATSVVSVNETIGNIKSGSLTYEYYDGANNTNAAPDEVWLLIEESDGTRHVVRHTSNDDFTQGGSTPPGDEQWLTRNVHLEIDGDPDPEDNPNFFWFDGASNNIPDSEADGNQTADLGAEFGDDATVLAMGIGVGSPSSSSGVVPDIYYRNPQLDGESLDSFPTACFRGETDFSAAFAWWVPIDHGNEIQTDTVEFDLGFYTEQCRHNDGSGMNNEGVSDEVDDDAE